MKKAVNRLIVRPAVKSGAKSVVVATLFGFMLSGCALMTGHPQSAEEFRQAVGPGKLLAKHDIYEVDRPFKKVAADFKKKAPECLDIRIETTSRTNRSYQVVSTRYKVTVVVNKERAELHVQQHHEKGVMNVTKEPEGGYYLIVADAIPIGKKKTKIDIYYPSFGFGTMVGAIKGWTRGKVKGCPDLTKDAGT